MCLRGIFTCTGGRQIFQRLMIAIIVRIVRGQGYKDLIRGRVGEGAPESVLDRIPRERCV